MEKIVEQGLLYDFYGELLTEHQKKIYEDVVYNDLSHDLVRRCSRILQDYEDKLHLVQRFMKIKENIGQLEKLTADEVLTREELVQRIELLSRQILEEL